jgi:hypothetical protein
MRSVELLWREEVIQIDVGLPHVLPVGVNDLQEGIHPETDIGTAIHLAIVVGRGGEAVEEGMGVHLDLMTPTDLSPGIRLADLEKLLFELRIPMFEDPAGA